MTITAQFKENVLNNNIDSIHMMMKSSMIFDTSFKNFDDMALYATKNNIDLYDDHDGYEFITDKKKWDKEYLNIIMVQVLSNFSRERIIHLKDVILHVYRDDVDNQSDASTSYSYQEQKAKDQHEGNYRALKTATGAVIGAGIGAGIGAAVGSSIVVSGLVGAIVVGGATLVVTNK